MKKILALTLSVLLVLALCAGCGSSDNAAEAPAQEAAAGDTYLVTFSTGETYNLPAGEDLVFFFQCDAPGDMGAPADGDEGAGITVSQGTVSYSNVGVGGPNSYPTSELVTVTGITGDITVTVTDAAASMDATHTIYFDETEIADAIAYAEEMAAQMAANPMSSGEASDETTTDTASTGSAEQVATSADYEIEVNGVSGTAHYEDTDNGDQATKTFLITFDGSDIEGEINMGVWTAVSGDDADQAVVDAVQAAFEGNNTVGPEA